MNKKNCICDTNGVVKKLNVQGLEFSTKVTVEYEVEGQKYEITESLAMKPKIIKLGFIPIGYKTKSLIEIKTGIEVIVGNKVNVKYNSTNPSQAYLPDNDAKISWN